MLKTVACNVCGKDAVVSIYDTVGDFEDMFNRLELSNATCGDCEEAEKQKRRETKEQERREHETREAQRVPNAFARVVGSKYRNCSLESFSPVSQSQVVALAAAKNFSTDPKGFLYLHGRPGVGKTHLAAGIFRDHAKTLKSRYQYEGSFEFKYDRFEEADYWTVPELLFHLRSQIGEDKSEEHAVEFLLKSKLLILDDLGAEKITDWVRQAFYVVISRRERDELPTVITSNLSLGEIEARVGDDRITSRIGGAARIVKIDGKDGRLENRKAGIR